MKSQPGTNSSVSDVKAGDVIDAPSLGWDSPDYPPERDVVEVHNLGRKVGDGTVDWITFRVRPHGSDRKYTDAMGPFRADDPVRVIA